MTWAAWLCLAVAAAGCIYTLAAAYFVSRFSRRVAPSLDAAPGVSVLKPLHGAEARLYENLSSFCAQTYPGAVQVLFAVSDPADPCIPVVHRLIAEWPQRDLKLVVDGRMHGANAKVSSLINLETHIAHDVIVLADSDIRVTTDYLAGVVAMLAQPGTGLVTCLYRGEPLPGLLPRVSAMAIDYQFLPSVLVGVGLKLARPCFGSTIALRRRTLSRVGGFQAFADHLADDNAIGEAVRATGMDVAIAPFVVAHLCFECTLGELLRHELRWARTIRAVDRWGFVGSVITYPLAFALLAAVLSGFSMAAAFAVVAALGCRLILHVRVDRAFPTTGHRWWLIPIRDILSFLVFAASFFVAVVNWRGRRYRVRRDGKLTPVKETAP